MRSSLLVAAFMTAALLPAPSRAQERGDPPRFGGYLKLYAHPQLMAPHAWDRLGTRLQISVIHQATQVTSIYAAFDAEVDEVTARRSEADSRGSSTTVYPVEAYIQFRWDSADLRLGKQYIFWGRTDWVNPTDNITPWDYTNIGSEIEEYRLAVPAARLDLYPGAWDLQAVLVPVFTPNRIAFKSPSIMSAGSPPSVLVLPEELPATRMGNLQYGLRASSYVSGFDFSLSWWRGFDLDPTVRSLYSASDPGVLEVHRSHVRQTVLGVDGARAFGAWVVKGEAGYIAPEDGSGEDEVLKYVLGGDWLAGEDLSLNIQLIEQIVQAPGRSLSTPGMPVSRVGDSTRSWSARIQWGFSDWWDLQVIGVQNLEDRDFFLLPILSWQPVDATDVYLGATLFRGPSDSPFGRSRDASKAFLELKYSF